MRRTRGQWCTTGLGLIGGCRQPCEDGGFASQQSDKSSPDQQFVHDDQQSGERWRVEWAAFRGDQVVVEDIDGQERHHGRQNQKPARAVELVRDGGGRLNQRSP